MGKKLLVCDLDGTLLNSEERITAYTQDVLLRAKRAGMLICFASGRNEQLMNVYCSQIGNCDYIISDNGALVRCGPGGEVIRASVMPQHINAAIMNHLFRNDIKFAQYSKDMIYWTPGNIRIERRFRFYEALSREMGCPLILKKEIVNMQPGRGYPGILKTVAYEENDLKIREIIRFTQNYPELRCEATGYGQTGLFNVSVSKKTALIQVIRHAGVCVDRVYVFGDYENDLSMFECAKNRIAMANAVPSLKEKADFVTRSNDENGVAYYIENFLL
ncbi:MAG: HAD family hydrolase [Caldicoprobacterales bacterium]|nr:Cof-type HAD-IIB family hydrolase [Clostridiales bacterium]